LFSRHNREAAIGALAVERLIVTPQARLVIAEHAFGPALEKLNFGRDRLWRDLRIVMPSRRIAARQSAQRCVCDRRHRLVAAPRPCAHG
jgi:hypothetical protein